MNRNLSLLILALLVSSSSLMAQLNTRDSTRTVQLWSLGPGTYVPAGHLADRYLPFASAGLSYHQKNREGQFYGVSFDAFYGTSIKDPGAIFGNLMDDNGNFIGVNGEMAILNAGVSGGQLAFEFGKLFLSTSNPNSGWLWMEGIGIQETKINVRNERGNFPQLQDQMLLGYDQLHRGPVLKSQIRYLHLGDNERINFSAGLVVNVATTKSVRGFNTFSGLQDNEMKWDMSAGFNFTWILPVYAKQESFFLTD